MGLVALVSAVGWGATLGVNPEQDVRTLQARFEGLARYLADETSIDHEIRVAASYAQLGDLVATGAVEIAVVSPFNYVDIRRRGVPVDLVGRLQKHSRDTYGTVILVRRDEVADLERLVRRTFLFFDRNSASNYMVPLALLKDREKPLAPSSELHVASAGHNEFLRELAGRTATFGATASNVLEEDASQRAGLQEKLFPVLRGPEDIPFDAIVLSPRLPTSQRALYRRALGKLAFLDDADVRKVFSEASTITGVRAAADEDYDSIRRAYAVSRGSGVLLVGLSLAVEPGRSVQQKRAHYRRLREALFAEHGMFVSLAVYGRGQSQDLLNDLREGRIDIAELPPIAAGVALRDGAMAVAAPLFEGHDTYQAVLIGHHDAGAISYPAGIASRTLAVLAATSASGHAYPRFALEEERGVRPKDLMYFNEPYEVISAVANGAAEVGAIAVFDLEEARSARLSGVDLVEEVPGSRVSIPTGAWLAGSRYARARVEGPSLSDVSAWLIAASVNLSGDPRLGALAETNRVRMEQIQGWVFPPNRTFLLLIVSASLLIAAAGGIFVVVYSRQTQGAGTVRLNETRRTERVIDVEEAGDPDPDHGVV